MSKTFSGKEIVSILSKKYGFREISTRGSHVKMRKNDYGKVVTTIVPLHPEVLVGTLRNLLRLAKIDPKDFIEKAKE